MPNSVKTTSDTFSNEDLDVENQSTSSVSSSKNHGSAMSSNEDVDGNSDSTRSKTSNANAKAELGRRETQNVSRLRYIVLAILLIAAVGVSILVFFVSRESEREEMTTQFESASGRLQEAFKAVRTDRVATLASLAVAATVHGVDHSRDWPFVTLSSYQERAFTTRSNSGALQVSIAPLVSREAREEWERFVVSNENEEDWIESAIDYQDDFSSEYFIKSYGESFRGDANASYSIQRLHNLTGDVMLSDSVDRDMYVPTWEISPFLGYDEINIDLYQDEDPRSVNVAKSIVEKGIVSSGLLYSDPGGVGASKEITVTFAKLLSIEAKQQVEYKGDPMTYLFIPIFDSFDKQSRVVAVLMGVFNWADLLKDILPADQKGVDVVLRNVCYEPFTFRINGHSVVPVGRGDQHETEFDELEVVSDVLERGSIADGTKDGLSFVESSCLYSLSIYPSQAFEAEYSSALPWILVSAVAGVLLLAIVMFFVYDRLVEARQTLVLDKALQSAAIVSSLFPQTVRDRLMNANLKKGEEGDLKAISALRARVTRDKQSASASYTEEISGDTEADDAQVIADLFPNCTVLFADIAGFTAWSSAREPSQVFTLLQNLYSAFDLIAKKRRVFKVETIGDSYVAVTGLPEPQEDHAMIMAKFARDCLHKMYEVTGSLELVLGPGTTDLSMRFGLNSGQVTGGVLRGDRARFQLFGDTVNTAARMESTGHRGRIQISQSTADNLILVGKDRWIRAREDKVEAKGKGTMQTYWLEMDTPRGVSDDMKDLADRDKQLIVVEDTAPTDIPDRPIGITRNQARLVGWMSEVLQDYVKQIVTKNQYARGNALKASMEAYRQHKPGDIALDELVEAFAFPEENALQTAFLMEQYRSTELDKTVVEQLHHYVEEIAVRYREENPFHNFAHACHVTMSVHKLMKRVYSDSTDEWTAPEAKKSKRSAPYGILTSDPLTLFAIVFSGLIHDVDHRGVSNVQLAKEDPAIAEKYRNKSIAEQHSFDVAWDLLMSSAYDDLRKAIFPTYPELMRFRQVVVGTVLATDIFDKEMGDMRKARWKRIFGNDDDEEDDVARNTRATIVLEHIIQASDVSHTMQHWHVYTKWSRRLFEELHLAYKQGRMGSDPAEFWYEGELKFFDNYVIPLARKLRECYVFGVSSDEYLQYALSNRFEWAIKGRAIVDEMVESLKLEEGEEALSPKGEQGQPTEVKEEKTAEKSEEADAKSEVPKEQMESID